MTPPSSPKIRLGTRNSPLARWQAQWVAGQLTNLGIEVELIPIVTAGDVQQQGPIGAIGTSGVFTKEIQRALLDGRIDLAVHSLKDLPTEAVEGLVLACVPPRESAGDALVSRDGLSFEQLPQGARIGTGSLRRQSQLLHARPDLRVSDVRGNVDTRLRKLHEGHFEALVLAEAGLRRLELAAQITEVLPKSMMLPAVGQGALGLETRTDDSVTRLALAQLDDATTHAAVLAERALLSALRGGCLAPIGAWARLEADGQLHLSAVVLSPDGVVRRENSASGPPSQATALGRRVADSLVTAGAAELIQQAREQIKRLR